MYGEFTGSLKEGVELVRDGIRDSVSSVFYMVRSHGLHLSLGASENITRVREGVRDHFRLHHESGLFTDRRHNLVLFPLEHLNASRFFDYAPLLARHFSLDYDGGELGLVSGESSWRPTRRERDTFHALVANPHSTDEQVGLVAGVSRQTVNVLRNKFVNEGLLKLVAVPRMHDLGFNLMSFTHLHLNPHKSSNDLSTLQNFFADPAHVLHVSGDLESVLLSYYTDYGSYRRQTASLTNRLRKHDLLLEHPSSHVFPLDETESVVDHEYGGIVSDTILC